jgi:hypothetical protein
LIRRTFGGQTDTVLNQSRRAFTSDIEQSKIITLLHFPATSINSEIKKLTEIGEDYIEELLLTQKDSQYSFPILALLYPEMDYKNNSFHQDHLYPVDSFNNLSEQDKVEYTWRTYNSILNLQMLDANENMSKNAMDLKSWVEQKTQNVDPNRFLENHIITKNINLELSIFSQFIKARKILLIDKMKSILN